MAAIHNKSVKAEDAWENRELGADMAHTRRVSSEREKDVDDSLDLQLISLRLQKALVEELKHLARESGIGYQPYIRQLLTQHVYGRKRRDRTGTYG